MKTMHPHQARVMLDARRRAVERARAKVEAAEAAFPEAIKKATAAELTHVEIADRLGISRTHLYRLIRGAR